MRCLRELRCWKVLSVRVAENCIATVLRLVLDYDRCTGGQQRLCFQSGCGTVLVLLLHGAVRCWLALAHSWDKQRWWMLSLRFKIRGHWGFLSWLGENDCGFDLTNCWVICVRVGQRSSQMLVLLTGATCMQSTVFEAIESGLEQVDHTFKDCSLLLWQLDLSLEIILHWFELYLKWCQINWGVRLAYYFCHCHWVLLLLAL